MTPGATVCVAVATGVGTSVAVGAGVWVTPGATGRVAVGTGVWVTLGATVCVAVDASGTAVSTDVIGSHAISMKAIKRDGSSHRRLFDLRIDRVTGLIESDKRKCPAFYLGDPGLDGDPSPDDPPDPEGPGRVSGSEVGGTIGFPSLSIFPLSKSSSAFATALSHFGYEMAVYGGGQQSLVP